MSALISIAIKNFRGFGKEISFSFDKKPLVLLTVPNGKGKTTLMDAVEWCFTGDIYRLHKVYDERNPSTENNIKSNKKAILKNKEHLNETTTVTLQLEKDGQMYTIIRSQNMDTLDDCGQIWVNNKTGDEARELLDSIIDCKNFYKYHVCDMQKTYNFLRTGRSEMSKEFSDFTADYSIAESVVANLGIYCDDIKQRISNVQIVPENDLMQYRETLEKHQKAPEILPYDSQLLYPSEPIEIKQLNVDQLNEHLRVLYSCGYSRILALLEKRQKWELAEKRKKELHIIQNEFLEHKTDILNAAEFNKNEYDVLKMATENLQRYSGINLTVSNLVGNREVLLNIGSTHFTEKFWKESASKLGDLKKQCGDLDTEISTLNRGNKVINALTSITTVKEGLLQYRIEQQRGAANQPVLCPVCGSERFGIVSEDEIVKEAKSYQIEHRELIEKKIQELDNLREQQRLVTAEQLEHAKAAHQEGVDGAQKIVDSLTRLFNTTKAFFTALKKLQATDAQLYAQENMLTESDIYKAIENNNAVIPSAEQVDDAEQEVIRILKLVNYSSEKPLIDGALLEDIRPKAAIAPKDVLYNESILSSKISSIRSHINNLEYLEASRKLNEAIRRNDIANQQIDELEKLSESAKLRIQQIRSVIKEANVQEYDKVGPYLYKIFRKLSRDISVSGIQLNSGKGDGLLTLVDAQGQPILNMLSDGQLSVFMLSYFLGNAFRLKSSNPFQVYFVDDITSCMDDINMLAFLDFIKYQLSSEDSAIKQLFFATCDSRIQEMIRYKMDHHGVAYKELGTNEFDVPVI